MSFWNTVKKIAPTLVSAVGGPYTALASTILKTALGDESMDDATLESRIVNPTAEDIAAIKKADNDFKVQMRELDIKEDELIYGDKASARDMQKVTRSRMPAVLAILTSLGFFCALGALMFISIPETSENIVMYMLGALNTAWIASVQFFVGTTKSSQNKSSLMAMKV